MVKMLRVQMHLELSRLLTNEPSDDYVSEQSNCDRNSGHQEIKGVDPDDPEPQAE